MQNTLRHLLLQGVLAIHAGLLPALAEVPVDLSRGLRGPEELAAFVDGMFAAQFEANPLAGAAVVVVADGRVYYAKGYGFADLESRQAVDPERTLFRLGSITRLFTFTAAMQLVDQRKLELDLDVNTYLRVLKVPSTFPRAVSMAHLMTQAGGFEQRTLGLFTGDAPALSGLAETIGRELPARVRPPAMLSVDSTYEAALAGLVVEEITAQRWEEIIEQGILVPLGMTHATPRQPVPESLAGGLATEYRLVEGTLEPQPLQWMRLPPAGGMSASPAAMARFIAAHLMGGELDGRRILSESSIQLMHSGWFTNHPAVNGMTHGFRQMNANSETIVGWRDASSTSHAFLALLPDRGVGVFVCYNSDTGGRLIDHFWQAFLNHYFPECLPPPARVTATLPGDATRKLAGDYMSLRYSGSDLTKLGGLADFVRVRFDADGRMITRGPEQKQRRWLPDASSGYREAGGNQRLAIHEEDGQTYLFADTGSEVWVRKNGSRSPSFQIALIKICLAFCLSAVVFWPVVAFCSRQIPHDRRAPLAARGGAWIMSLLWVVFACIVARSIQIAWPFDAGLPALLNRALWIPWAAALFVLPGLFFLLQALGTRYWSVVGRLHYAGVVLSGLILVWVSWHWRLMAAPWN